MAGTAEAAVGGAAPGGRQLLPAPEIDLRRAARVGLIGGVAAIFVSAIGMVERFEDREVVVALSLGYILLLLMPLGAGYVAASPPEHREGFAPSERGARNVLAGLVAGAAAGLGLGLFAAVIGNLDVSSVLINLRPGLVDLLTLGLGLASGFVALLVGGAALGAAAGAVHLLDDRWRKLLLGALVWVVTLGVLQALFFQVFRGARVPGVNRVLYETGGGLSLPGTVIVVATAIAVAVLRDRARRPVAERLGRISATQRRKLNLAGMAVMLLMLGVLPHVLGRFLSEVVDVAAIFLLMALGLNIVVGFAGLLDLGYVAFFAVGAYTTAVLTSPASPGFAPELTFWSALPLVILASAVAGLVVGTPVLRMRGDYLAIVTLGFGEIARLIVGSDWQKGNLGGAQGIIKIPDISVGPVVIQFPQDFFYAILAFVLIAAYVSYALQDSRMGRAWMAMREDESVAEAMGINTVAAKLWAFVIGAILAGFAGSLFAVKIGSTFPHDFDIVVSITVLVLIIVGGLGSVPGVIVGAFVLVGLPELLREFSEFKFLIYGALLIFMMLKRPEGFIPSRRRAQELHEEEVLQDAWLKAAAEAGGPAEAE